jgi:hypothetical protein
LTRVSAGCVTPSGSEHPGGAALIARYDELLVSFGVVDLPRGDLVHGDFNTCNVLLTDGAVSAVIDIEELGSGTRVIDPGCLLREAYVQHYHPEVKRRLRRAGESVAGPGPLAVCAVAAAFFIVGFKLRYEPAVVLATMARLAPDGRGPDGFAQQRMRKVQVPSAGILR